jgi:hypothetical protein
MGTVIITYMYIIGTVEEVAFVINSHVDFCQLFVLAS